MKKRTISLFFAVLMILSAGFSAANAAEDGISPHSEACRFCDTGSIRTTSSTKQIGTSPIDYLEHSVGGYLYACPIYATQTTYTEKCSNSKCGYIYRTWTEDGTKVVHNHNR